MNLSAIIKRIRERCPTFATNCAGAAELAVLMEAVNLPMPSAYVIPTGDDVGDVVAVANGYNQTVTEKFSVAVIVDNTPNERGQTGANTLDPIRRELFKAILGYVVDANTNPISYDGSDLYQMDRARIVWEFRFKFDAEINTGDTSSEVNYDEMPDLKNINLKVDAIDPMADKNHPETGKYPGPDGRIEFNLDIVTKGTKE